MKRQYVNGFISVIVFSLLLSVVPDAAAQNFADLRTEDPQIEEVSPENVMQLIEQVEIEGVSPDELYTIGKTDVISVTVMRHPEVSGLYEVSKDGKIQFEFVGDIFIDGLTKKEVSDLLTKKLSEYVINPQVTVKIEQFNSKVVYVVGEVYRPGKIFMRGNTITIRDALLEAGLPMLSGITKKSRLITPSEAGKGRMKEVNVYSLLFEGDLRENFVMNPGDVLYIPPTFLTKTMRAIQPVTQPISSVTGTGAAVGL